MRHGCVQAIAKVPGLGPKRALQLSRELGITSVAELADAVRRGRLHGLSGFGAKSEERILRGIGVITRDAALRDVLRSQRPDAPAEEIYTALAGYYETAPTPGPGKRAALVRGKDLRGDLHTHTDLTDGVASLEAMIEAARGRGYEYYAVTDHAPNLVMQRMTTQKMPAQRAHADTTGMVLALLPGGGHCAVLMQPGRFLDELLARVAPLAASATECNA